MGKKNKTKKRYSHILWLFSFIALTASPAAFRAPAEVRWHAAACPLPLTPLGSNAHRAAAYVHHLSSMLTRLHQTAACADMHTGVKSPPVSS